VSRDELNAGALAELEALDRILAREPVAEEHLELAALVDSVRGNAAQMTPEFSAKLASRFEGRERRAASRRRWQWPGGGRLAFASGGFVTAAVALTILLSGSARDALFGGGSTATPGVSKQGSVHAREGSRPPVLLTPTSTPPGQASAQTHKAPAAGAVGPRHASNVAGGVGATSTAPTPAIAAPNTSFGARTPRLVARGSSLTLASPPSQMQTVADQIVAATEQQGGVVEHSSVDVQGPASYASFSLQVPSGRLGHLIATLSSLASVRSLSQSTQDITSPYQNENVLLSRRLAELGSLRKQLAVAATAADAASLRKQIGEISHRIAIERATIKGLRAEASNATLSVQVVAGAAVKKHSHAVGPLTRAYHDALHALQEILAIALIVLAILLPFALCALALWWAATSVRQRARERAIRAA
jgi:hypothetical protein